MSEGALPVAIVGAGPTGIACAGELASLGIASVCLEKGAILDTLQHFPEEMTWFSTREQLEICGVPFATPEAHPNRLQSLAYYRLVAQKFGVRVEPGVEVESVTRAPDGGFRLRARGRGGEPREIRARAAVVATGFFHNPRRLGVPGEAGENVFPRYVSGFPFHDRDVVVVGGKNSASEAALDLYRHGARVTLVVRGPAISERVKYWIRPDLENRIREGAIRAHFRSRVAAIGPDGVRLETPAGNREIPAAAVFPLIGYEPDFAFFERCGVLLEGERRIPSHDAETCESNVPGLYLAGAILGGTETGRIFIEQSRRHVRAIAAAIAGVVRRG